MSDHAADCASRISLTTDEVLRASAIIVAIGGPAGQVPLFHRCTCDVAQQGARALRFAARVIDCSREGGDAEGSDIQEWAVEAGLLVPTEMSAPCSGPEGGCVCAEYYGDDEWPVTCYRDSPALAAARGEDR